MVLPFGWDPVDRDRILRFFRHAWPDGVYEDALGPYRGTFSEALRFAPRSTEFFVYASQEALCAWAVEGAGAMTVNTMVHVIGAPDTVTLVLDEAPGSLDAVATELRDALTRNRFDVGEFESAA